MSGTRLEDASQPYPIEFAEFPSPHLATGLDGIPATGHLGEGGEELSQNSRRAGSTRLGRRRTGQPGINRASPPLIGILRRAAQPLPIRQIFQPGLGSPEANLELNLMGDEHVIKQVGPQARPARDEGHRAEG
ncbi:MAG TPA: hypothetical protein VIV12_28970 [Streptosporangiaceae bacterium]